MKKTLGEKSRKTSFNETHVTELITRLSDKKQLIPEHLQSYIQHFIDDLNFLLLQFEPYSLDKVACIPKILQEAWATVIDSRFDFLFYDKGFCEQDRKALINSLFDTQNYALSFTGRFFEKPLNIYYSQAGCNYKFASHDSLDKRNFAFKDMELQDVAMKLRQDPLLRDEIPVRVASIHVDSHQTWVALNNRGFTTLCLAGLAPLRLLPTEPTAEEKARLLEPPAIIPKQFKPNNLPLYAFFTQQTLNKSQGPYSTITVREEGEPKYSVYRYDSYATSVFEKNNLDANCRSVKFVPNKTM